MKSIKRLYLKERIGRFGQTYDYIWGLYEATEEEFEQIKSDKKLSRLEKFNEQDLINHFYITIGNMSKELEFETDLYDYYHVTENINKYELTLYVIRVLKSELNQTKEK